MEKTQISVLCWLAIIFIIFFLIVFLSNKTTAWSTILVGQPMSLRSYIFFYWHGARRGRGDSRALACMWRQYLLYSSVRHPRLKSKKLNFVLIPFMQSTLWLQPLVLLLDSLCRAGATPGRELRFFSVTWETSILSVFSSAAPPPSNVLSPLPTGLTPQLVRPVNREPDLPINLQAPHLYLFMLLFRL